jgi:hypothetical protein
MLVLALAAYFLAVRWGYSAAEAIFAPISVALILIGLLVATAVALSAEPAEAKREFLQTVERDFADLYKVIRRKGK